MALSKRLKKTILALFVLVIPSICYMLLRTGTNYYHSLPVYGPEGRTELSDSLPDSAWFRFEPSRFASLEAGKLALEDKIYVAGFLRGRVSAEAETLAVNMVRLAKTYEDMERLEFIAFIATDSASSADSTSSATPFERLLQDYDVRPERWVTLRLPEADAAELARRGFFLQVDSASETGRPLNDTVVLIDSRRRIRGYYDASSYFATDTLEDEIAVLWKEEMNLDDHE